MRLAPIGYRLGLVDEQRYQAVERKRQAVARELDRLGRTYFALPDGCGGDQATPRSLSALEYLRRSDVSYRTLVERGLGAELDGEYLYEVEVEAKYEGYIAKQRAAVERVQRLEERLIPRDFDYDAIAGFRTEAREKLKRFRPATLGQASRIEGVTPADAAILLVHLERARAGHGG